MNEKLEVILMYLQFILEEQESEQDVDTKRQPAEYIIHHYAQAIRAEVVADILIYLNDYDKFIS